MILGISGRKQSGKSTVVEFLKKQLMSEYSVNNFADALKIITVNLFVPAGTVPKRGSAIDWIELNKNTMLPHLNMTVRQLLQFLGTDVMRGIWSEVWINAWKNRLPDLDGPKKVRWVLVSDVRFMNEVDAVKALGGKVIRLTRNPFPGDSHSSEADLDGKESVFDAVIDNNVLTIEQTNKKVWDLVFGKDWISL